MHVTYTQVTPQLPVLRRYPEPPPVLQADVGLARVPGPVLLQEPPFEVRQDPVHVNKNPQSLTRSRGGRHVYANPLKRITEQSFPSSE